MARGLSLRARLAVLVAVGATAVLSVAAFALYRDLSSEVSDALTTELEVRMGDLAADLDDPTSALAQRPVVAQAVDPSGAVLTPTGAPALLTARELAAAHQRELVIDRAVPGIGPDARLLARRLDTASHGSVVGVAATTTAPLEHVRHRLLFVLALAGPALTTAITVTAWLLAGAALRPVRRMAERAETISMTAPGERLPQPLGHDEIAQLGGTLNQMLARIEATIAHERAFIDDASHELRTPLAVLRGELELAAEETHDPAVVSRGLQSALEETDRLSRLSVNLLTLARADAGQLRTGSVETDLLDTIRAATARVPHDGVDVTVEGAPATVRGEPEWIGQIVTNLVTNATQHARSQVRVFVENTDAGPQLTVADDGPGFPPGLLPGAFDRFTRAEGARSRGGTGLGLAIVASLAKSLAADVRAGNGPPLGGGRVDVTFIAGPT